MSWLSRIVSSNARRVRDEAAGAVRAILHNPINVIPDVDALVERAIRWAARKLGVKLSDGDARWVKSQIDAMAMVRECRRLGANARELLADLERWEREGKL